MSEVNDSFQRQLAAWRDLTLAEISGSLPLHEPRRHLYDLVTAQLSRAGKGIRPALCIATAKAFGGKEANALPSAAALEMLHNAFLVHDDIEDGSELRRNHPTMVAEHGVPLAVNTGDAMNALSIRLLRRNLPLLGAPTAIRIYEEIDALLVESLEGQAMELGWIRDNDTRVGASDYLRMTLKKTCLYSFIHPMRIGALVADGERTDLDRFDQLGFLTGNCIPDSGRCVEPDRRPALRQGDRRRPDGGQTLLILRPTSSTRCLGREVEALRDFLGRPSEKADCRRGTARSTTCCANMAASSTHSRRRGNWRARRSASSRPLSPGRRTRRRGSSSAKFSTTWSSVKPENRSEPTCCRRLAITE